MNIAIFLLCVLLADVGFHLVFHQALPLMVSTYFIVITSMIYPLHIRALSLFFAWLTSFLAGIPSLVLGVLLFLCGLITHKIQRFVHFDLVSSGVFAAFCLVVVQCVINTITDHTINWTNFAVYGTLGIITVLLNNGWIGR